MFKLGNLFQMNPDMTPDQVDTRRLLIANMLNQGRQANTVGEGIVALAGGVLGGVQGRNLDTIETTNRQKATDAFNAAMGGWSPFTMGSDTLTGSAGGDTLSVDGVTPAAKAAYDALTAGWGNPLTVTSAYRSPEHNAKVGGAKNSQHTHGNAFDISTAGMSQAEREQLIRKAQEAGFTGIGVYDNSLHFDVGPARAWGPDYSRNSLPDWAAPLIGGTGNVAGGGGTSGPMTGQAGGDMLGGNSAGIYQALANPWLSQEQRAALMAMLEQNDPLRQLQLREAQLRVQAMENPAPDELTQRAIAGGLMPGSPEWEQFFLNNGKMPGTDATQYGTSLNYFTRKDGSLGAYVIGQDGQPKEIALPEGAAWAQGVEKIDLGTEWGLYDKRTGTMIGREPKNVSGEAAAKAEGTKAGEAAADAKTALPNIIAQSQQSLDLIHSIMTDPALPSITGMVQGRLPPMSQAGTDLAVKIEQLQGKTFLEAFASLKGGGAITEREGQAAQEAIARLNRAQSTDAYIQALNELAQIIQTGMARAQAKAGQNVPAAEAAPTAPAPQDDPLGLFGN